MNRFLYTVLISAITIAGFSMYKQNDSGYISFRFADFSFETNLIVFIAAVLCVLFVVLLLIRLFQGVHNLFHRIRVRRQHHLKEQARMAMSQGLIEYAEGRFRQSEKTLLQHIKYSDNPLLVYLTAARAAQQLGAYERRDEYLKLAHADTPNADVAISLTRAEMQLAHHQNEQALATLTQLNEISPNHSYVLTLLANTYHYLNDWEQLELLLPKLKKFGNLSTNSYLVFEVNVCKGRLSGIARNIQQNKDSRDQLLNYWHDVSAHLKALPEINEHYARQLMHCGLVEEAESVLRNYLNGNWHESTIILYSGLDVRIDSQQLQMVENWLQQHRHNAYLLLALGKHCINRALWGKARNYLEASIAIKPMPENHLKLARLLEEHMNEQANAHDNYRKGLQLLAGTFTETRHPGSSGSGINAPQLKIVKS